MDIGNKPIFNYAFLLTLATVVTLALHYFALRGLDHDPLAHKFLLAYAVNFSLALLIGVILFFLRKKYTSSLGFIFMIGSMVKFAFFFVFFHPAYNQDLDISKLEFTTFFIPYLVNLIVEILFLIRVLNRMEA